MTVSDLITALAKLPKDLRVLVRGYEANHNEIHGVAEVNAAFDVARGGIYGKHAIFGPEADVVDAPYQLCDSTGADHDGFKCEQAGFQHHKTGRAVVLYAGEDAE